MPDGHTTTPPPVPDAKILPKLTQKLLEIVGELTTILEEEATLLKLRDSKRMAVATKRKQELVVDYQTALRFLSENITLARMIPEQDRAKLKEKSDYVRELAEKHAEAIRIAHSSTDRLLGAVMDETRKNLHNQSGYSQRGHLAAAGRDTSRPAMLNQQA